MIHLRNYTAADFDALHRVDQQCFDPLIAYSRAELDNFVNRTSAMTIVAVDTALEEEPVTAFIIVDHERPKSGHIITIDVLDAYRRQGVGTQLIREAEARSLASQRRAMLLEVAVANHPARRFYERHGYVVLRKLPDYYKRGGDALLMGKNL
ncbi:MAG: GNAT family N-acetyltransferase [Acidobacteriales bacterium]|nr:GNAT family N-acetyltransferase [Terriglobales bacterium]